MMEETTLADLRVLDLSEGVAGAFCARLFADYGADVIALSPSRSAPPLTEGKRSVTLDISTDVGRLAFRMMVEKANVIVETFPEGHLDSFGLGFAELEAIKRRIILVSIEADGASEEAQHFAGLNAFAAAALVAFNADSNEIPQHIRIRAGECLAAVRGMPGGSVPTEEAMFTVSTVEWTKGESPRPGEHTTEILAELELTAEELSRLHAGGAG
jgi:crotonobetainyl-CoA:carnitine CoA-transferase CaiB-like acyl-CoA transferase